MGGPAGVVTVRGAVGVAVPGGQPDFQLTVLLHQLITVRCFQ